MMLLLQPLIVYHAYERQTEGVRGESDRERGENGENERKGRINVYDA